VADVPAVKNLEFVLGAVSEMEDHAAD